MTAPSSTSRPGDSPHWVDSELGAASQRSFGALLVVLLVLLVLATACGSPHGEAFPRSAILLAAPTTLVDSGLLDTLLPVFEERAGYTVKTLAVGTGEAVAMARRGDADVLLGHAPTLEKEALAEGFVRNRRVVMTNDFLLVGPEADPAAVAGEADVAVAALKIADTRSTFVSRGDDSGTHRFERSLWRRLDQTPAGAWYVETGQGMGASLQVANQLDAYTLVDRATYLAFHDRISLRPLVTGDPRQLNVYSVMEVDPERFPRINQNGARAFADFLVEPATQKLIADFGRDRHGEALYRPVAGEAETALTNPQPLSTAPP